VNPAGTTRIESIEETGFMDWRTRCGHKLVSLEESVSHVQSGQIVAAAPFTCTPTTLCQGLVERGRRGELENVRIDHLASMFCWTEPEMRGVFRLRDNYATLANRAGCHAGETDYLPIGLYRSAGFSAQREWLLQLRTRGVDVADDGAGREARHR
jgi:acyl-CoA hydrolase